MPPDAAKRLWDALEACRKVEEFTASECAESFAASELLRSAVERQLEIVGEALNKASLLYPELSFSIPEVPRIVGLRNRLIHGYDKVDEDLVWDVVQTKIGPLRAQIARLLESIS